MNDSVHAYEAERQVIERLTKSATEQLKEILEQKHIYQRVLVDAQQIVSEAQARVYKMEPEQSRYDEWASRFLRTTRLTLADRELNVAERATGTKPIPCLVVRNIKVFCSTCDTREVFRPVWFFELANELRNPSSSDVFSALPENFQLFFLAYQCQRYEGAPEAFLVRREGWHLILDGRSPMENIEVPAFIPRAERHLFRDAMIAIHGGKTLAALFYLRIFIEQFARRQTGLTGRITGEEIMSSYTNQLPAPQRGQMPSLKHWYDQLSEAIHGAKEDAALFEEAQTAIVEHFDFRRIFKISDQPPSQTSTQARNNA